MTTQTQNKLDSQQVMIAAVVIGVVLLAIFMGVLARHNLGGSTEQATLSKGLGITKESLPSWLVADAKQTHGDITKLSPAEQQKIRAFYPGNGAVAVVHAAYALQNP